MLKTLLVLTLLTSPALAQMAHTDGMAHDSSHMMAGMVPTPPQGVGGSPLSEGGQSAFAAIAEVVQVLEADPMTDWSTVDIAALREHLRDMDIVTIDSTTTTSEISGGLRFEITGNGEVAAAIRRMVTAHAGMMDGTNGWHYTTEEISDGAAMEVRVPANELPKLKALGFYGLMASGMHHQPHHWAMATGSNPHAH